MINLESSFYQIFEAAPERFFFAPGRINLIGEHLDYNGGAVLPSCIERGNYAALRPRRDSLVRLMALDYPEVGVRSYDLEALPTSAIADWTKYPLGMLRLQQASGLNLKQGVDLLIAGDLPIANGLSSSHALMVLCAMVFAALAGQDLSSEQELRQLAQLTQRCEHEYIGVQSGIMDGFVIALGKKDEALLLNTKTLDFRRIGFSLFDAELWILDSRVPRELSASAYNARVAECKEALGLLQRAGAAISELADLNPDALPTYQGVLRDPLLRRVRHISSENRRTHQAAEALAAGEIGLFGELLNASHVSLRDDYQVTGEALDTLYDLCSHEKACLGARMTGAGFGGCFIALLTKDGAESALQRIARSYYERLGLALGYFCYGGGAAGEISETIHNA